MTKIRTTCTACGVVELTVENVCLEPGRYRFDCPTVGRHSATLPPAERQTFSSRPVSTPVP